MPGYHTVRQGECLSSIAKQYGFSDYKQIYNHGDNADFREQRPNPNIICPGDQIYIPEKETKAFDRGVDQEHQFVLRRPKVLLRLVVQDEEGNPVPSAEY